MTNNYFRSLPTRTTNVNGEVRQGAPQFVFTFDDSDAESARKAWTMALSFTPCPVLFRPFGDATAPWYGCRLVGVNAENSKYAWPVARKQVG